MGNENITLQGLVFKAQDLTTPEKIVALCLIWHRNQKTGRCDPGQARICMETGLKERAVREAIHGLVAKKLLVATRTQKTTRYQFCAAYGSLNGLPALNAGLDRQQTPVGKSTHSRRAAPKMFWRNRNDDGTPCESYLDEAYNG